MRASSTGALHECASCGLQFDEPGSLGRHGCGRAGGTHGDEREPGRAGERPREGLAGERGLGLRLP
jgi:hypothetical protein